MSNYYTTEYYNGLISDLKLAESMSEDEACRYFNADSKSDIIDVLNEEIDTVVTYIF